jgi:hypothetical protein
MTPTKTTFMEIGCCSCKQSFKLDVPLQTLINTYEKIQPPQKLQKTTICPHCGTSQPVYLSKKEIGFLIKNSQNDLALQDFVDKKQPISF